jgi:tetratricopeptide (TPR) repeat protein
MIRDKNNVPKTAASVKAIIQQGYRRLPRPLLAVVITALLIWWLIPLVRPLFQKQQDFDPLPKQRHLLVLAFTNVDGDPAGQAFCDGLVENLTRKLSQLEQFQKSLRIVPAADARESGIASASAALQRFGVNLVVAGNMQGFNDSYHLTLSLLDTKTLRQLKSELITVRMDNLVALQEGIVEKVLEMLDLELVPESQRMLTAGGTNVPDAYEFYLQACGCLQGYKKAENLDAAINLFEQAIGEDPLYASACAGLGEACWRKYETTNDIQLLELALEHCKRAVELSELLAPAHATLGLIYKGTGRNEEATKEFQLALELDPANISTYRELATAYENQGRLLDAELTYQQAIDLNPDNCVSYSYLGVFYRYQGRYEDAAAQFRQAIQVNSMYAKGYRNLGGAYYLLGREQDAEKMTMRALEFGPDYAAYSNLAFGYWHQERYADAARFFEKALQLDDTDYRIWAFLASAYYWIPGKEEKARDIYQRAITMVEKELKNNPRDQKLLSDLALYCATAGKSEKARTILQQLVDSEPDILDVIIDIGFVYERLGERELALKWIEKALEKEDQALKEIEDFPDLRELRADERFQALVQRLADKTR